MTADPTVEPADPTVESAARADALATAASRISGAAIDEVLAELRVIAAGDREAIVQACERLRRPGASPRERAVQHMAFSLVSALFEGAAQPTDA